MKIAFVDFVWDPARPGASGLSDIVWDLIGYHTTLGRRSITGIRDIAMS